MNAPAPAIFPRASVASPCIGVCLLEQGGDGGAGFCRGCARTIEEIGAWLAFSPAERAEVMAQLAARKAGMPRDFDSDSNV